MRHDVYVELDSGDGERTLLQFDDVYSVVYRGESEHEREFTTQQ